MNKTISTLLGVGFLLVSLVGCAPSEKPPDPNEQYEKIPSYKHTVEFLGENTFPIGAWMAPLTTTK